MLGLLQRRVPLQHRLGRCLGLVEQTHIPRQAGQLQLRQAMLPGAKEVAGSPELQVLFCQGKAVGGGTEGL